MLMISVLPLLCVAVLATDRTTVDDYINTCKDPPGHKAEPGHRAKPAPDGQLTDECAQWNERACCSGPTQSDWINLNWDHCRIPMSDQCKTRFRKDNCFFHCSPNLGPWIVPDPGPMQTERFKHLPLCKTECDNWWNDCKNDYTCTDNWITGLPWKNGTHYCSNKPCKLFKDYFSDAKSFCEGIWRESYTVVSDTSPCMLLDFTGTNPNDAVAKCRTQQLVGRCNRNHQTYFLLLSCLAIWSLLLLF